MIENSDLLKPFPCLLVDTCFELEEELRQRIPLGTSKMEYWLHVELMRLLRLRGYSVKEETQYPKKENQTKPDQLDLHIHDLNLNEIHLVEVKIESSTNPGRIGNQSTTIGGLDKTIGFDGGDMHKIVRYQCQCMDVELNSIHKWVLFVGYSERTISRMEELRICPDSHFRKGKNSFAYERGNGTVTVAIYSPESHRGSYGKHYACEC